MLVGWTEKDWLGRKARASGSSPAQVQPLS
jgi:hypothetical protein